MLNFETKLNCQSRKLEETDAIALQPDEKNETADIHHIIHITTILSLRISYFEGGFTSTIFGDLGSLVVHVITIEETVVLLLLYDGVGVPPEESRRRRGGFDRRWLLGDAGPTVSGGTRSGKLQPDGLGINPT